MRFLAHQFGSPLLVSRFISIFLVSSQMSRVIENAMPGIPNKKNSKGLPPKTLLTPGTYNKKMKTTVSVNTPKNMCLLNPE